MNQSNKNKPLNRHQEEILNNLACWNKKVLLQKIYADYYNLINGYIKPEIPGHIIEIGSGIGVSKKFINGIITTDLFPNNWIDVVCSAYNIPFKSQSVSHIIAFDVFHHLQYPVAFLKEAFKVLISGGRLIIFEPYISLTGLLAYGLFHPEPIGWKAKINISDNPINPSNYYAAQGNATRLFFKNEMPELLNTWKSIALLRFAGFSYLLSGGYSKPSFYPIFLYPLLKHCDAFLSKFPKIFAVRCLVVLEKV